MAFIDPEGILAGSIIVASVTFLAIYGTLYPFVFNYFLQKPEPERAKGGMAYWKLFTWFIISTFLFVIAALTATLALASASDVEVTMATGFFVIGLVLGTSSLLAEIASSRAFLEPYARENVRLETFDKEFQKALPLKLKPSMSEEQMMQAIMDARLVAAEKAEKAAKESGFRAK